MDADSAHVRRLSLDKISSQGKQMPLWKRLLISNIVNIIAVNRKRRRCEARTMTEYKKICKWVILFLTNFNSVFK